MAHKNYSFLYHLIEYFKRDCYVFVHIDKKSDITKDKIAILEAMPQVSGIYKKYSVHWGGFSILKAQLYLIKQSANNCDAEFFHIISGQDYPIKPLDSFLNFFEKNYGFSFMSFVHLPHPQWQNNTYERFQYYFPYDYIDKNDKKFRKIIEGQLKLKIKRRIPQSFDHLYGGSQWMSLHRKAVEALLKYEKKSSKFYNRLRFTFAPEETYFTSVLVNIMPQGMVINNNHRFIRWEHENGNIPANLGIEHFYLLVESDAFFARKMESPYCEELIKKIDQFLLADTEIEILPNGGWNYCGMLQYEYDRNFVDAIVQYAEYMDIHNGVDCGCGSGYYVTSLRKLGLDFTGFDANPYTKELTAILSTENNSFCVQADLTKPLEFENQFDLVLCLNVLQYIPKEKIETALENLVSLTKISIIIGWDNLYMGNAQFVLKYFSEYGFRINLYLKKYFESQFAICSNFYILEK